MKLDKPHIYDGLYYQYFIDPRFREIREAVVSHVEEGARVLDIACGTGALAFALAQKGVQVTGIDLSAKMVAHAEHRRVVSGAQNPRFIHGDAAQLSGQGQGYDYAVISMALHEMTPDLRLEVIRKAKRLAVQVILADYTSPLPVTLAGIRVRVGEFFSGVDHFQSFLSYQRNNGLDFILAKTDLSISKEVINPRATLRMVVAK